MATKFSAHVRNVNAYCKDASAGSSRDLFRRKTVCQKPNNIEFGLRK